MDVFDFKMTGSVAPFDAKTKGVARTAEFVAQGNSLPENRQARVGLENSQNTDAPPDMEQLRNLVDQANKALSLNSSNLKFTIADGTNINVVRIEDSETGELIRQIPSEAMLAIARAFDEITQGAIIEERA